MRSRSVAEITVSRRMRSRIVAWRCSERSTPYNPRLRNPESVSDVSRSVLDGSVPVFAAAPPKADPRSTIATRLPK